MHAEDLQRALAGLHSSSRFDDDSDTEQMQEGAMSEDEKHELEQFKHGGFGYRQPGGRKRSGTAGSVVVYHPKTHGDSEDLPAVMVEDMTGEGVLEDGTEEGGLKMLTHTARPPVELMEGS